MIAGISITGFEPRFWAIIPVAALIYALWLRERGALRELGVPVVVAAVAAGWYGLYFWFTVGADQVLASSWLARIVGFAASVAIVILTTRRVIARTARVAEQPAIERRRAG